MKLFSRLGGLVAIVAILMAAGSLLAASPVAAQEAVDFTTACAIDATDEPAPGSSTKVTVFTGATAWIELSASSGSISAKKDGDGGDSLQLQNKALTATASCGDGADNIEIGQYAVSFYFNAPDVSAVTPAVLTAKVLGQAEGKTQVVTITPGPTEIKIAKHDKAIAADDADGIELTATLSRGTKTFGGKSFVVTTTRGRLQVVSSTDNSCVAADETSDADRNSCTGNTDADGMLAVVLIGDNSPGIATVTFESDEMSESTDVVLSGDPKTVTAVPAAVTMQRGAGDAVSSNLITVTVVDANGNAGDG